MFRSYAQNFEDVMLWRALKHVGNGTYVDVGAQHPVIDSVSLAFYERGWRGVHVEPAPDYARLLREHRPDEVVLQAALDARPGLLAFFDIKHSGLSTADEDIARRHGQAGFEVHEISVPSLTLDDVFSGLPGKEIHWLKIDVEGYERQVLEGWMSATRPWVIVIESTLPLTETESYQDWEQPLLDRGYKLAYLDGINRFYVAAGHLELLAAFRHGPNYFDRFQLSQASPYCDDLNAMIESLREQERALGVELAARERQAAGALAAVANLEVELAGLREQNEGLQGNVRAQEDELHRRQAELSQRQSELARLQAELAQLRAQGDALLEKLVATEVRAAGFETQARQALQAKSALEAGLAEARSRLEQQGEEIAGLRARADWLEAGLNAASSQVEQSTRTTHHWWTVAVGLSHELDVLRGSRSWRITAPLRAASSLLGRSRRLGMAALATLIGLARRGARWVLLLAVSVVQARPGLKARVSRWVAGFPRLEAHLRAFVSTRWHKGRTVDAVVTPELAAAEPPSDLPVDASVHDIDWAAQPPSVRKAYGQLVQARHEAQQAPDPADRPDAVR